MLAALAALRLAGRRLRVADAALALASFFVVFLALHPFPDPARLDCAGGGAPLLLTPFEGPARTAARLWAQGRPLADWLTNLSVMSAIMNVVLFTLPGAALALHTRAWRAALAFGLGLSLFNELSQLTALWGIYPCRYRSFAVDDLIFNTVGVMIGFAVLRALRPGRADT